MAAYAGSHIYRNASDTVRVEIARWKKGEWNYYIFFRDGSDMFSFAEEVGDLLRSHRDAKADAERRIGGKLISHNHVRTVDEGWERTPPRRSKK